MTENLQSGGSARPLRSERVPVSCGECRRRKQRCNQGQPCSNCARRYPQPTCEYIASTYRKPDDSAASRTPTMSSIGQLPSPFVGDELAHFAGFSRPLIPPKSDVPVQQPPWTEPGQQARGSTSPLRNLSHWHELWPARSGISSIDAKGEGICPPDCTLHSKIAHDASMVLCKIDALPAQFVEEWQPERTDDVLYWMKLQSSAASPSSSNQIDAVVNPVTDPTREDAVLLRFFVSFISRFKASIDGDPDVASNLYMRQYVPFCLQSNLLVQTAIYTSACFLDNTGSNAGDGTASMVHKYRAIRMLNEHIQTQRLTTDEAIAAVMQMMLNEWYWGNTSDLTAHLSGLKEMIRLRGGYRNLGLNGLLARLIMISDITIALSFEMLPHLQGGAEYDLHDISQVPFRVSLNTPLVPHLVEFSKCAEPLRLHQATAQILDDIRFLTSLVLALPEHAFEKDLQKVQSTSAWIHNQILGMPNETPVMEQHGAHETRLPTATAVSPSSSGQRSSPIFPQSPGPSSTASALGRPEPTSMDLMYQAVRQAALIYARAIMNRKALSDPAACSEEAFLSLWVTVWRVPLKLWKSVLGVFVWIMLSIGPASRDTQHARYVKSLLTGGLLQASLEDWDVSERAMKGALKLVTWLSNSRDA